MLNLQQLEQEARRRDIDVWWDKNIKHFRYRKGNVEVGEIHLPSKESALRSLLGYS